MDIVSEGPTGILVRNKLERNIILAIKFNIMTSDKFPNIINRTNLILRLKKCKSRFVS